MEQISEVLNKQDASLRELESALSKLRESGDIGQGKADKFEQHIQLVSNICSLLTVRVPPGYRNEGGKQVSSSKARMLALEILFHLPTNDALRPVLGEVMGALLFTAANDVEENAAKAASTIALLSKQFRSPDRSWKADRDGWLRLPEIVQFIETQLRDVSAAVAELCNDGYDPSALADVAALSTGKGLVGPMKAVLAAVHSGAVSKRAAGSRPAELAAVVAGAGAASNAGSMPSTQAKTGGYNLGSALPGRYSPKVLLELLSMLTSYSGSEPVRARAVPSDLTCPLLLGPKMPPGSPVGLPGLPVPQEEPTPVTRKVPGQLILSLLQFSRGLALPDVASLSNDVIPSDAQTAMLPYISSKATTAASGPGTSTGEGSQTGRSDQGQGDTSARSAGDDPSTQGAGASGVLGHGLVRMRALYLKDLHECTVRVHFVVASLTKVLGVSLSDVIAGAQHAALAAASSAAGGQAQHAGSAPGYSHVDQYVAQLLYQLSVLPPHLSASRRELFTVMGHFQKAQVQPAASEFSLSLVKELPLILDARVWQGGRSAHAVSELLRVTAWQLVADCLYLSRDTFTLNQLAAIVACFTQLLRDPTCPTQLAIICGRMLAGLTELVVTVHPSLPVYEPPHPAPPPLPPVGGPAGYEGHDRAPARSLLCTMLHTAVDRLGALRNSVPRSIAAEKRAQADAEREKAMHMKQVARISAAADLVATEIKARQCGQSPSVSEAAMGHAHTLVEGLTRGTVSPWVQDQYNEAHGAPGSTLAPGVSAAPENIRELRSLISVLMPLVKQCLVGLINLGRTDAESDSSKSAAGAEGHYNAMPATPGADAPEGVSVVSITAGGPNGLGLYSHGVTLGEGELTAVSRYLEYTLDVMDAFVLSTTAEPSDFSFVCAEYASLLQELALYDRNHLRDLLSTGLVTLLERCFRNGALYTLVDAIIAKSYYLCKVVVDSLLYFFSRHVHYMNVDDEEYSSLCREYGPGAPPRWVSEPAQPLPGQYGNEQAEHRLFNAYRSSVVAERRSRQALRGRMIAAGEWRFNEDGEFDHLLHAAGPGTGGSTGGTLSAASVSTVSAGAASNPDSELAEQQRRTPSFVLAIPTPPGETLRKRALVYATMRANIMVRIFKHCLTAYGVFAHNVTVGVQEAADEQRLAERQQQIDNIRLESLMLLKPFIGPLIRSLLRNAMAVHVPTNHLQALRMLLQHMTTELDALRETPHAQPTVHAVSGEFAPLTPLILDTLLRLHASSADPDNRAKAIMAGLQIPLRLNQQLPYLPKLLKVVTLGLRWKQDKRDIASMALNSLAFWCDNLSRGFLDVLFQDTGLHADLMHALLSLLRTPLTSTSNSPSGYPNRMGGFSGSSKGNVAMEVLRILPKLAGLNRSHLHTSPPKLPHSLIAAHAPGLVARASFGASTKGIYTPPEAPAEHNQEELERFVTGLAAEYGVSGAASTADMDVDEEGRGGEAGGSADTAALSLAQRAIARLKQKNGTPAPAEGKKAGGKRRVHASSSSSTTTGPAGGDDSSAFDLPLDKIIHSLQKMLTRQLTLSRDRAVDRPGPENPLLAPILQAGGAPTAAVSAGAAGAGARIRRVRERFQPSNTPGTRGGEHDWMTPVRRRRRHDDDGSPLAVLPTQAHKPLPVNVAASLHASAEADCTVTVYAEAYASDSDSDVEGEEGYEVGPIVLTPTQQLFLARRGPLVAKRSAWELLSSLLPFVLQQVPSLGLPEGGNITSEACRASSVAFAAACAGGAVSHLYDERGQARVGHVHTPHKWQAVSAGAPQGGSPTAAAKQAGGVQGDADMPLGYDGAADLHSAMAKASSARRAVLEYMRALAFACADVALRPLARPVFMTVLRACVLQVVQHTPAPLAEQVPPAVRGGEGSCMPSTLSTRGDATLAAGTLLPSSTNASAGSKGSTEDGGSLQAKVQATRAASDPFLLNVLLASLACDEPPHAAELFSPSPTASVLSAVGTHPFLPLLLECMDEAVGALCLLGQAGSAGVQGASKHAAAMDEDITPGSPPGSRASTTPDQALQVKLRDAMSDPSAQLHAVAVTGRLFLADLLNRLATAAQQPSVRAKQGACHALIALLSRCGRALAQAYTQEILHIAVMALRECPPEQAAITTVAAYNVVLDVVSGCLPACSSASSLAEMVPLSELPGLAASDRERLEGMVKLGMECLQLSSASAREVGAYMLGSIVRHFLQPVKAHGQQSSSKSGSSKSGGLSAVGPGPGVGSGAALGTPPAVLPISVSTPVKLQHSSAAVARGVLTLLLPHLPALHAMHFSKRVSNLAPPAMLAYTCTLSSLLNLCAEAKSDGIAMAPLPAPAASTGDAAAPAAAAAAAPLPDLSGCAPWRQVYETIASPAWTKDITNAAFLLHQFSKMYYDVNGQYVNAAYSIAMATTGQLCQGPEAVLGAGALLQGRAAPPMTVIGAVMAQETHTASIVPQLIVSVSSASNPAPDLFRSVRASAALLSAVQAFPYPLRPAALLADPRLAPPAQGKEGYEQRIPGWGRPEVWYGGAPPTAAVSEPWQQWTDPYCGEVISTGPRFTAHTHGLPSAVCGVLAQTIDSVAAHARLQGTLPEAVGVSSGPDCVVGDLRGLRASTNGYGALSDPITLPTLMAPRPSLELQPRPYSHPRKINTWIQFKSPNFQVLLRVTLLGLMESMCRAFPQHATSLLPAAGANGSNEGSEAWVHLLDEKLENIKDPSTAVVKSSLPWFVLRVIPSTLLESFSLPQSMAQPASNVVDWGKSKLVDDWAMPQSFLHGHHEQLLMALGGTLDAMSPVLGHAVFNGFLKKGLRAKLSLFLQQPQGGQDGAAGQGQASADTMLPFTQGAGTQHLDDLALLACKLQRVFIGQSQASLAVTMLEQLRKLWLNVHHIRDMMHNSGREMDIAGGIANLFSVLPLDPVTFLPAFAHVTHLLDSKLHQFRNKGPLTSSLRAPFARFCSVYPLACARFFFGVRNLLNPAWSRLLLGTCHLVPDADGWLAFLRSSEGLYFFARACFPDAPQEILQAFPASRAEANSSEEVARYVGKCSTYAGGLKREELQQLHGVGLLLLRAMAGTEPAWLPSSPAVVGLILYAYHADRLGVSVGLADPSLGNGTSPVSYASHAPTAGGQTAAPGIDTSGAASGEGGGAAVQRALAARQVFHELPWRRTHLHWQFGNEHARACVDLLAGLARQAGLRARAVAALRAEEAFQSDSSQLSSPTGGDGKSSSSPPLPSAARSPISGAPPCVPYSVLAPVLLALLDALLPSTPHRIHVGHLRYILEEELAPAPDIGLRVFLVRLLASKSSLPHDLPAMVRCVTAATQAKGQGLLGATVGHAGVDTEAIVTAMCGSDVDPVLSVASSLASSSSSSSSSPTPPGWAGQAAQEARRAAYVRAAGLRHVVMPLLRRLVASEESLRVAFLEGERQLAEVRAGPGAAGKQGEGAGGSSTRTEEVEAAVLACALELRQLYIQAGGSAAAWSLGAVCSSFLAGAGGSTAAGGTGTGTGTGGTGTGRGRTDSVSGAMEEDAPAPSGKLSTPEPVHGHGGVRSSAAGGGTAGGTAVGRGSGAGPGGSAPSGAAAGAGTAHSAHAAGSGTSMGPPSGSGGTNSGVAGRTGGVVGQGQGGPSLPSLFSTPSTTLARALLGSSGAGAGTGRGGGFTGTSGSLTAPGSGSGSGGATAALHLHPAGSLQGGVVPGNRRWSIGTTVLHTPSYGPVASTPRMYSGLRLGGTPFTPLMSVGTPRYSSIPWGEAVYKLHALPAHTAGGASGGTAAQGGGAGAGAAGGAGGGGSGQDAARTVFTPVRPFPSLLDPACTDALFTLLQALEEESDKESAGMLQGHTGPLYVYRAQPGVQPVSPSTASCLAALHPLHAATRPALVYVGVDTLKCMELLLLLVRAGEEVQADRRHLLILHAWRRVRVPEPALRAQATVFLGRYGQVFPMQFSMHLPLLEHVMTMLQPRASQPPNAHLEYREHYKRAFNMLLPSLAMRHWGSEGWTAVIRSLRKQMVEEATPSLSSMALLPVVLEHAQLLYPRRHAFLYVWTQSIHRSLTPSQYSTLSAGAKTLMTDTLTMLGTWQALARLEHLLGGLQHIPVGSAPAAGGSGGKARQVDPKRPLYPFEDSGLGCFDIFGEPLQANKAEGAASGSSASTGDAAAGAGGDGSAGVGGHSETKPGSSGGSAGTGGSGRGWSNTQLESFCTGNAARAAILAADGLDTRQTALAQRSSALFAAFLRLWPDVELLPLYFARGLTAASRLQQMKTAAAQQLAVAAARQAEIQAQALAAGRSQKSAEAAAASNHAVKLALYNQPSMVGAGSEDVMAYVNTTLELMLTISGAEGKSVDFLAENPGFIMECLFSPALLSSDKKTAALLRRLLRRLLVLYPLHCVPLRVELGRMYHFFVCSTNLRASFYNLLTGGLKTDDLIPYRDHAWQFWAANMKVLDQPVDRRLRYRELLNALEYVAQGKAYSPVQARRGVDASGQPLPVQGDTERRITEFVAREFPDFDQAKAQAYKESYTADQVFATEAWKWVETEFIPTDFTCKIGTPGYSPLPAAQLAPGYKEPQGYIQQDKISLYTHGLNIVRLLRDCIKYNAATVLKLVNQLLLHCGEAPGSYASVFVRTARLHLESEAFTDRCARDGLDPAQVAAAEGISPDMYDPDVRHVRSCILVNLMSMQVVMDFMLGDRGRDEVLTWQAHLLNSSSDSGVLRTSFRLISTAMTIGLGPTSVFPFGGLPEKRQREYLSSAFLWLNMPDNGYVTLPRAQTLRIRKVSTDTYNDLQEQYYFMLFRMALGNENAAGSVSGVIRALREAEERREKQGGGAAGARGSTTIVGAHASSGKANHTWFTMFVKQFAAGMLASHVSVRERCMTLLLGHGRWKRVCDMRAEHARMQAARVNAREAFLQRAARRRGEEFIGPAVPGLAFPSSDPYTTGRSPYTNVDLQTALLNRTSTGEGGNYKHAQAEETARYTFYTVTDAEAEMGGGRGMDSREVLQTGLDASVGAALEHALQAATGSGAVDRRTRCVGFAGIETWGARGGRGAAILHALSGDASAGRQATLTPAQQAAVSAAWEEAENTPVSALTALQDILCIDWDSCKGYLWLLPVVQIMLRSVGVQGTASPSSSSPPTSSTLPAALARATLYSVDLSVTLWSHLFPAAWSSLSPLQRTRLLPWLTHLLSKDWYDLFNRGSQHDALRRAGTATYQTTMTVGVKLQDSERDSSTEYGAAAAEGSWSSSAASMAVISAVQEGSGILLGQVEAPAHSHSTGPVYASSPVPDLSLASSIQLLAGPILACSNPAVPLPAEVLTYFGRCVGMSTQAQQVLEARVEEGVAAVRAAEETVRAEQEAYLALAGRLAQETAAAGGADSSAAILLNDTVFAAAIARPVPGASEDGSDSRDSGSGGMRLARDMDSRLHSILSHRQALAQAKVEVLAVMQSLASLYTSMGAEEQLLGLGRRFASTLTTARGVDMELAGLWTEASEAYSSAFAPVYESLHVPGRTDNARMKEVSASLMTVLGLGAGGVASSSSTTAAGGKAQEPSTDASAATAQTKAADVVMGGTSGTSGTADRAPAGPTGQGQEVQALSAADVLEAELVGVQAHAAGVKRRGEAGRSGEADLRPASSFPPSVAASAAHLALGCAPGTVGPNMLLAPLQRVSEAEAQARGSYITLAGAGGEAGRLAPLRPAALPVPLLLSEQVVQGTAPRPVRGSPQGQAEAARTQARKTLRALAGGDKDVISVETTPGTTSTGKGTTAAASAIALAKKRGLPLSAPVLPLLSLPGSPQEEDSSGERPAKRRRAAHTGGSDAATVAPSTAASSASASASSQQHVARNRAALLRMLSALDAGNAESRLLQDQDISVVYSDLIAPAPAPAVVAPAQGTAAAAVAAAATGDMQAGFRHAAAAGAAAAAAAFGTATPSAAQGTPGADSTALAGPAPGGLTAPSVGASSTPLQLTSSTSSLWPDPHTYAYPAVQGHPPHWELLTWEQRWVDTQRKACNWHALSAYAQRMGDNVLLAEACGAQSSYEGVYALISADTGVVNEMARSHTAKLLSAQLWCIINKPDAPARCNMALEEASHVWLTQWQALPALLGPGQVPTLQHESMLTSLQKLSEVRESMHAITALRSGQEDATASRSTIAVDFRGLIATWRDRLPDLSDCGRAEGLSAWESLLSWRQQLFSTAIERARGVDKEGARDEAKAVLMQDTPWTVLCMARVARRMGQRKVASAQLQRLSTDVRAMDVYDSIHKLFEELKLYLPSKQALGAAAYVRRQELQKDESLLSSYQGLGVLPGQLPPSSYKHIGLHYYGYMSPRDEEGSARAQAMARMGLALAQSQAVDSAFTVSTRSELFRLQGLLCETLGGEAWPSAYMAYAASAYQHAQANRPVPAKVWLSWAQYLDRLHARLRAEVRHPYLAEGTEEGIERTVTAGGTGGVSIRERPEAEWRTLRESNGLFLAADLVVKFAGDMRRLTSAGGGKSGSAGAGADVAMDGSASASSGAGSGSTLAPVPLSQLPVLVACQAISSYMEAVGHTCHHAALQLARPLWLAYSGATPLGEPHQLLGVDSKGHKLGIHVPSDAQIVAGNAKLLAALSAGAGNVPLHVWIQWLPQLFAGIGKADEHVCLTILRALRFAYPQAIQWQVRAMALELTEARKANPTAGVPPGTSDPTATYVRLHQELMYPHHSTVREMDGLAEEVLTRVTQSSWTGLEDDLLACLHATLVKTQGFALTLVQQAEVMPVYRAARLISEADCATRMVSYGAKDAERAVALCTQLVSTCLLSRTLPYSTEQMAEAGTTARGGQPFLGAMLRHNAVLHQYKDAFLLDFSPKVPPALLPPEMQEAGHSGEGGMVTNPFLPATVEQLLPRLRLWRTRILSGYALQAGARVGSRIGDGLDTDRPLLGPFASVGAAVGALSHGPGLHSIGNLTGGAEQLELPGQYQTATSPALEVQPSRHVRLARLLPVQAAHYGPAGLMQRVTMLGDDGRRYTYAVVKTSASPVANQESRMSQMGAMLNVLLGEDPLCRAKHLSMGTAPVTTPLGQGYRLVLETPSVHSMAEALEDYLRMYGPRAHVGGAAGGRARSGDDLLALYRQVHKAQSSEAAAALAATVQSAAAGTPEAAQWADRAYATEQAKVALDKVQEASYKAVAACVPEHALSLWATARMCTPEAVAGLRTTVARTMSTSYALAYSLHLHDRHAPGKLGVSLSTGAVVLHESVLPTYANGLADPRQGGSAAGQEKQSAHAAGTILDQAHNGVPFRLCRGLVSFLTPQAVLGTVAGGMMLTGRALMVHTEWLTAYLGLFFRDETAANVQSFGVQAVAMLERKRAEALAKGTSPVPEPVSPPSPYVEAATLLRRAVSNTGKVLDKVHILAQSAYGPHAGRPGLAGSSSVAVPVADTEKFTPYTEPVRPGVPAYLQGQQRTVRLQELLVQSTAESTAMRQPATYHPWF